MGRERKGRDRDDDDKKGRKDDSSDEIPIVCPVYAVEAGPIVPGTFVQLWSGGPMLTITAVRSDVHGNQTIDAKGENYKGQPIVFMNKRRPAFRRFKQTGVA